jgi:hypothetical protein
MAKRGRPKKERPSIDGKDYGPVFAQIQIATRLGWSYRVEENRVRMEAPTGFQEKDAPMLAETWLGTCFARGYIDRTQYEAGIQFQSAIWRAFGRPFAPAMGGTHGGGEESDPKGAQRFAVKCKEVLAARSRRTLDDVVNLCQYDRAPALHRPHHVARLQDGLEALAEFIGLRRVA